MARRFQQRMPVSMVRLLPLAIALTLLWVTNGVASARVPQSAKEFELMTENIVKSSSVGAKTRSLLQAGATPAPQEVVDAAVDSYVHLLELNTGARNPLVTLDVPCEEYQPDGGPYILQPANRHVPGVPKVYPTPARTCTFLEGIPVIVVILFSECYSACSPTLCDCCDGSLNTFPTSTTFPTPNNTCPLFQGTDCSYCADELKIFEENPGPDASLYATTLTDLSTNITVPLEIFYVPPTFAPTPSLPPNSVFDRAPPPGDMYTYGPGPVQATGPVLVAGYYAYIQPSQLTKGHSYRIVRKAVLSGPGANGNLPVVYDFTIAGSNPCDTASSAPNQCFNAEGTASVCCAGQCRNPPLAIPSCQPADLVAASPTCNASGPLPNQCFNAPGTASVCCAGSCPDEPGPNPVCG